MAVWDGMAVASEAAQWKRSEYFAAEQDANLPSCQICKHPVCPLWRSSCCPVKRFMSLAIKEVNDFSPSLNWPYPGVAPLSSVQPFLTFTSKRQDNQP